VDLEQVLQLQVKLTFSITPYLVEL
jgi:hypothetical protein